MSINLSLQRSSDKIEPKSNTYLLHPGYDRRIAVAACSADKKSDPVPQEISDWLERDGVRARLEVGYHVIKSAHVEGVIEVR